MEHLWMELHGPYSPAKCSIAVGSIFHIGRRCYTLKAIGNSSDCVAMTHPNLRAIVETAEKRVFRIDRIEMRTAILTRVSLLNLTSEGMRYELCTIADTKHRKTSHEPVKVHLESLRVVNGIRRAAENDSDNVTVVLWVLVVR